ARQRSGDLAGAEVLYRKALIVSPGHSDANHCLGLCLAGLGRPGEAVELIRAAIAAKPGEQHYYVNLGDILWRLGRADSAEETYRLALAIDPEDARALCSLGEVLTAGDRFGEALEHIGRAAGLRPRDPMIANAKASTLVRAGRTREALAVLQTVIESVPDFARAHHTCAIALADIGLIEESESAARAAIALEPGVAAFHWQAGLCRYDVADFVGAADAFRASVRAQPGLAVAHAALGFALLRTGAGEEGFASLTSAVNINAGMSSSLEAVDYIEQIRTSTGEQLPAFAFKASHLRHALEAAQPGGLILELGVFTGRSLTLIAEHVGPSIRVHGFDSFEGLPEGWIPGVERGAYDAGGELPDVPPNATLHAGWFDDTLPRFVSTTPGNVSFANVDCDIYSSTQTFFRSFESRIGAGTVLVFDEYFGYPDWRQHEFRAFQEFIAAAGRAYEYLALSPITKQATVRIID
ncbi:MAG: tetratricopeptide repeat protein, partial [Gammaproteobacteria bacterium]